MLYIDLDGKVRDSEDRTPQPGTAESATTGPDPLEVQSTTAHILAAMPLLVRVFRRLVHRRWWVSGMRWEANYTPDGVRQYAITLTYAVLEEHWADPILGPEKASAADRLELMKLGLWPKAWPGENHGEG